VKLLPSDPDIQTIIARILSEDLDLQPDFQRGEVWSDAKKRRLIDTVLRDWHVPPIHVIERPDSHKQEVLDGQQRLAAIRDFVNGMIRVDASIEPIQPDLIEAHNCTYGTLPPNLRRRFDRFTIRVFRLVDFNPDEPGELFFRLNQPTGLTSAEQRNAFFGPIRRQVREMCEHFPSYGLSDSVLGFSNSRMAFDDIVAKLCLTIERGTIRQKITAATITERYRSPEPFETETISRCETALTLFGKCASKRATGVKFNKATLYSWLCLFSRSFFASTSDSTINILSQFVNSFELHRSEWNSNEGTKSVDLKSESFPVYLLYIFTDRSSLRVGDVSSVLLRDAVLAYCLVAADHDSALSQIISPSFFNLYKNWNSLVSSDSIASENVLLEEADKIGWGTIE
jgi:hypothetical protein